MMVVALVFSLRMNDTVGVCFIAVIVVFFCVESVLVRQKGIVFFSFFYSLLFSFLAFRKIDAGQAPNTENDKSRNANI